MGPWGDWSEQGSAAFYQVNEEVEQNQPHLGALPGVPQSPQAVVVGKPQQLHEQGAQAQQVA